MTISPIAKTTAVPFYPEYPLYNLGGGAPRQWEFNGWKPESLSWKQNAYIHGGLSGPAQYRYEGPDVEKFLAGICVNGFNNFKVGASKHAIMCTERGLIASHGVLQRLEDNAFRLFVSGHWPLYMHSKTDLNVTQTIEDNFLFQVAGPNCLKILEKVTKSTLSDIGYLRFRNVEIAGHAVEIMRVGMAGTLAYELHGPTQLGQEVYRAIFEAGQEFDIERLGWQTYGVNHIEAGFPQQSWTFLVAAYEDPGFLEYVERVKPLRWTTPTFSGSVDRSNMRARFRTPLECGWGKSVNFNHDFIGRAALEREHANPQRTITTLEWNADDVVDIYASLLRPGEEFKYLELPAMPNFRGVLAHADHVRKNGKEIGVSAGIAYSYYFRKALSHCVIDVAENVIGNEVTLLWGDHGGRIKEVRATVARYPYLNEGRNETVDAAGLR